VLVRVMGPVEGRGGGLTQNYHDRNNPETAPPYPSTLWVRDRATADSNQHNLEGGDGRWQRGSSKCSC